MKKLLLLSMLTAFISCGVQTKTKEANKNLLLGTWISADDQNYKMTINESSIIEYYDSEEVDKFTYKRDKDNLTKTDLATSDKYQYKIQELTKTDLKLIFLDRGNTLAFKKKQ